MIGGEHSITSGAIEVLSKKHKNLILIQLDAHADLREEWLGSRHNHACAMRRCLEVLPSKKLFQVGIRSGTAKEFLEMKAHKTEDIKLLIDGPRGLIDAWKIGSLHEEYKRLKQNYLKKLKKN